MISRRALLSRSRNIGESVPARNHETPPAKIIATAVSAPIEPPLAVVVALKVVVMPCRREAYGEIVSRTYTAVTVFPDSVAVIVVRDGVAVASEPKFL